MMEMTFRNARGQIHMDGGGGTAPFKIRSVEGLGYVNFATTTAAYPLTGGQSTLSRLPGARLITVAVDGAESGKNNEGNLARVAHDSGVLEIVSGKKRVYADSYVSALSCTRAMGGDYERAILQFTCDYPYFRDSVPTVKSLLERENLIYHSFTLPMMMSSRVTQNKVDIDGDKKVYPKIIVENIKAEEELPISVLNETTGARIQLRLPAGEYGRVVMDFRDGRVYSGDTELTDCISDESYMSDFFLAEGENILKITSMDTEPENSVLVCFENEYFSAWED